MAFPAIERYYMHATDSKSSLNGYLPPLTQPTVRGAQPRSSSSAESSSSSSSGSAMGGSGLPSCYGAASSGVAVPCGTLPPRPSQRAGDPGLPPRYGGSAMPQRNSNGTGANGAGGGGEEITHTRHTIGPIGTGPRQGAGPNASALLPHNSAPAGGNATSAQAASRPPIGAVRPLMPYPTGGVLTTAAVSTATAVGGLPCGNSRDTTTPQVPRSDLGSSRASVAGSSSGATGGGGGGGNANPDDSAGAGGVVPTDSAPGQRPSSVPESSSQPSTSFYAFLGLGGSVGSLAAAAQAAAEAQQAALRKAVRRDIKRMLAGNRAYVRAKKGSPPSLSSESLATLSQPKRRPSPINDGKPPAPNLPDPVDWARWKTEQLVIARMAESRRAAEVAAEQQEAEERLCEFRQKKAEAKQGKAEAAARTAAEEAAYRSAMCAYVNRRGLLDLEDFTKRREEEQERRALVRSRQAKGLSDHHY